MILPPTALRVALLLALCTPARSVCAQTTELFLDQTACQPAAPASTRSALAAALEIELLDSNLHPQPSFAPGRVGLTLRDCDLSDGNLSLLLVRNALGEAETTELELGDVPEGARARTAAVAVVEWLRTLDQPGGPNPNAAPSSTPNDAPAPQPLTSGAQDAAPPTKTAPPPKAAPSHEAAQEEPTAEPSSKASVLIQLGGGFTVLGPEPLFLPGGRLTLRDRLSKRLWLIGGASLFATGKDTSLGRARLHLLLFEAALGVNVLPTEWLTLSAVAQWGPSWAEGESNLDVEERPNTVYLVILRGRLELKVPLAKRWALSTLADFGPILRGVEFTAGGEPTFKVRPYVGEASLSLEFAP